MTNTQAQPIEIPATAVRYQGDYSISYGEKYQRDRDIKEIAKLVRADIKAAIQEKKLPEGKYSVKIDRFSGGQSLSIVVLPLQTPSLIQNPKRVLLEHNNQGHLSGMPLYTDEGKAFLNTLEAIVAAYNYDGSDSSVDYFNVNFYRSIGFDGQFLAEERRTILESL
jgi:hypothetical protein